MYSSWINVRRVLAAVSLIAALSIATISDAEGQIFKIPHPDTTVGNAFGASVDIDGNRAIIGASAENICGPNSGAAYIFERNEDDGVWFQVAKLTPHDCVVGDFFGRSLSIDGYRAVVAASGAFPSRDASNAAYVFERDSLSGKWVEVAKIASEPKTEEGSFAASVSLDGERVLITTSGDPIRHAYSGSAYIYERQADGKWIQQAKLYGSGKLAAGVFGGSGALNGEYAVVTASMYYQEEPGSIYIFERDPATDAWREVQRFGEIDDIFISVDLDGDFVLVGESRDGVKNSGIATLYERNADGKWALKQKITPRVPYKNGAFGSEVSFDGESALIAGYDEQLGKNFNIDRVVYEFKRNPETDQWTQRRIFDVGAVAFGYAIAADGGFAVIGQVSDQEPGAAYVVEIQ